MPVDSTFSTLYIQFQHDVMPNSIQVIIAIAPVLTVFILFFIFWDLWKNYVRSSNFLNNKTSIIELILPGETFKSPHAMEVFLNSLHNTVDGNLYAQYWEGKHRPWFSLEIVSIEGQVKFYIWMLSANKPNLMAALYSQFPEIEIREAEDYTRSVHFDPKEINIYGWEYAFTNKNKAYPIKTYVDYGLDKDPKEEFKIDPLVPMIEFLGSIPPNHQIWIQYIVRAHIKDRVKKGSFFKMEDSWEEDAKDLVNEIMNRDPKTKVAGTRDDATGFTKMPSISKGEDKIIEAVERRVTKSAFDVGIRTLYIAKKDVFSMSIGGGAIANMKHFSVPNMNGFKPADRWHSKLKYPWYDFMNFRRNKFAKLILMAYKMRSYFHEPFSMPILIMNSEELATLYHFPGSVAQAPNLGRVPSKRAQAPGNLPT